MSHYTLLVEDDVAIQEIVEKYLIKEGAPAFFQDSFDFVILDIMMPKVDGLEVVKIIREKRADLYQLFFTYIISFERPYWLLPNLLSSVHRCSELSALLGASVQTFVRGDGFDDSKR